MRQILYTSSNGAGWSSWCGGSTEQKRFMAEFPLLVRVVKEITNGISPSKLAPYVENEERQKNFKQELICGDHFSANDLSDMDPRLLWALYELVQTWILRWGKDTIPCLLGVKHLDVYTCCDAESVVRITDINGRETVEESNDWW